MKMTTREQAIKKANKRAFSCITSGCSVTLHVCDKSRTVTVAPVCDSKANSASYGIYVWDEVPEVPSKGSVLRVRNSADHVYVIRISTGKMSTNSDGDLCVVCESQEHPGDTYPWIDWEVLQTARGLVPTLSVFCYKCEHFVVKPCEEPCVSCKVTKPTNYKRSVE